MKQKIWIEWIGLWGSGKSTAIKNIKKDLNLNQVIFKSTEDYVIESRKEKFITFFRSPIRVIFLSSKLFIHLFPYYIKACLKKDKIAVSEFRSFFSCYLARLSFINSASKYNILWEGEMHLIPTIHLKKETISKVIDILLSVNQEMIYAIVSMDIEEDEAFTRIMADKNNGKNIRFNKDQKFTIDDLRKFSLFQKYLIETLNNKKIHFLEYDENQEDITKFIGKF